MLPIEKVTAQEDFKNVKSTTQVEPMVRGSERRFFREP